VLEVDRMFEADNVSGLN